MRIKPLAPRPLRRRPALVGLLLATVCTLTGCVPRLRVTPQVLSGSFAGLAADGQPITLTFRQDQQSFRGEGHRGAEVLVLAGAAGWRGVAALQAQDGEAELVTLVLSADGETLTLERAGAEPLALSRQTPSSPGGATGRLTGRYRAVRSGAPLAEVTLVERSGLVSGAGIVTGDPVGITGRVEGATARGLLTFLDGAQAAFTAELSADGRSLVIEGFGAPLTMTRRGGR